VNAAHAMKESGRHGLLRISTRLDGEFVRITISDTGNGIPPAIRNKVFDPFFTTKSVGTGTGQGLAIAHSVIVEKHAGTIRFDSIDGKGTVFEIRLPISRSAALAA
jgi:two-component system, NtrC family, sensor kinase